MLSLKKEYFCWTPRLLILNVYRNWGRKEHLWRQRGRVSRKDEVNADVGGSAVCRRGDLQMLHLTGQNVTMGHRFGPGGLSSPAAIVEAANRGLPIARAPKPTCSGKREVQVRAGNEVRLPSTARARPCALTPVAARRAHVATCEGTSPLRDRSRARK